ncbi:MAG: hypothetical protein KKD66_15455, partial [Proteobacteria bacterium]|nr:hypothetical protein [Pseudomonadota bacterium]
MKKMNKYFEEKNLLKRMNFEYLPTLIEKLPTISFGSVPPSDVRKEISDSYGCSGISTSRATTPFCFNNS